MSPPISSAAPASMPRSIRAASVATTPSATTASTSDAASVRSSGKCHSRRRLRSASHSILMSDRLQ